MQRWITVVLGSVLVLPWVEGTSETANTFTLTVDGATIGSQTTSARGPVTIPWQNAVGRQWQPTVEGHRRDATGNTGDTSRTITVST
jgi:hypothetical protein